MRPVPKSRAKCALECQLALNTLQRKKVVIGSACEMSPVLQPIKKPRSRHNKIKSSHHDLKLLKPYYTVADRNKKKLQIPPRISSRNLIHKCNSQDYLFPNSEPISFPSKQFCLIWFANWNTCQNKNCPTALLFYVLPAHIRSVGISQLVQRLATGWKVRGSNLGEGEIIRIRPDRPWSPSSLLFDGFLYRG